MEKRDYKWHLRRGGRKDVCPICGHRTFVPYVDANGNIAGAEFGRCDRENNCAYIKYPNGVETDAQPVPVKVLKPIRFALTVAAASASGNLFEYACRLVGREKAVDAWIRYQVGAFNNYAIFWQIDKAGEIRSGKLMEYAENGHRIKDEKCHVRWAHKSNYYKGLFDGEELQQCFFGEHLIKGAELETVVIVESEKTAVMMSAIKPEYIWLACGGSCGLKNELKNKVLKEYEVLLMPDNGKYWEWRAIAMKNGWQCSDWCEKNLSSGDDILDWYEKQLLRIEPQQ